MNWMLGFSLTVVSIFLLTLEGFSQKSECNCAEKIDRIAFPLYPRTAVAVGIGGDVIVRLQIDRDGDIVGKEILQGHKMLVAAVFDALADTKFINGKNDREVILTYSFSIIPNGIEPTVKSKVRFEPPRRIYIYERAIVASDGIPMEPNIPKKLKEQNF